MRQILIQNNYYTVRQSSRIWPSPGITGGALAWLAGIWLQLQQASLSALLHYQLAVLLALGIIGLCLKQRRALSALWLALACLGWGVAGWQAHGMQAQQLDPELEGQTLLVTGVVQGLPQWSADGSRFEFLVEQALLPDGRAVRLPDRLSLGWSQEAVAGQCQACVQPGERWQLSLQLRRPHGYRNPFGFDLERWMWEQGLGATAQVRAQEGAMRLPNAGWLSPQHALDRARLHVREQIRTRWSAGDAEGQRAGNLLVALVVGDQAAIAQDDWTVFRLTGIAHLVSISGLHVTMFAWLAAALVGWGWRWTARRGWPCCLWLPAQHAAAIGACLLAAGYAWFSGWGVPAQRTVWMLAVVALLRCSGRQWPWHAVLGAAAVLVTVLHPLALLQPGFWLSFVAVGVLFLTGDSAKSETPDNWWARLLAAVLAFGQQQLVVVLALTPLALLMFGQVSVVGILANAVAVPLVTVLVTPLAMLGMLWAPLWTLAGVILEWCWPGLVWMAAYPWAVYGTAMAPVWVGAIGIAGGALLCLRLPLWWRALGAVCLVPVLGWQAPAPPAGGFSLQAVDVGQGGAVLLRTARHSLLFDTGPAIGRHTDAGERILAPLLAAQGLQLDRIVLSHSDTDHVGGLLSLLASQPQARVSGVIEPDHPLQAQLTIQPCLAGQRWDWDGVQFEVLYPSAQDLAAGDWGNSTSCVLRVSNGQPTAMLMGDAEFVSEERLLQRYPPAQLRADVLLAGHHGSNSSTSTAWLQAVQPHWTLIQHGYRNRYGHPHAEVLQRLQEQGANVVRSDSCGAALWSSQDQRMHCERAGNAHFWSFRML